MRKRGDAQGILYQAHGHIEQCADGHDWPVLRVASPTGLDIQDDLVSTEACRASALHVQYRVLPCLPIGTCRRTCQNQSFRMCYTDLDMPCRCGELEEILPTVALAGICSRVVIRAVQPRWYRHLVLDTSNQKFELIACFPRVVDHYHACLSRSKRDLKRCNVRLEALPQMLMHQARWSGHLSGPSAAVKCMSKPPNSPLPAHSGTKDPPRSPTIG